MQGEFAENVISAIKSIPRGKVATYGQIAALAGNPRAARQVVRFLKTYSQKEKLPWHRVINARGQISLPAGAGRELQAALLRKEGVAVSDDERVDLNIYLWKPGG
jgi:methylated-DNA-protein-cysteine methyltransferase-like protein